MQCAQFGGQNDVKLQSINFHLQCEQAVVYVQDYSHFFVLDSFNLSHCDYDSVIMFSACYLKISQSILLLDYPPISDDVP